jgi:DNA-binding CsgD family transcriptional regulator
MPSAAGAHELLEREHELAELVAACRAALEGRGTLVVVEGVAGIGKTALLDEVWLSGAAEAFTLLRASGAELERELAFGVVRQLFERAVHELPVDARRDVFAGAAALAAPVLLEPNPRPAPEAVHAALHGLYWLAAELAARRPLALLVDDGHWADVASLRWLAYLGRRLDGVPLVAIVARRVAEPGVDSVALDEGSPAPAATVVRPQPLGEASVARLLEASYGRKPAGEFARACAAATGGNPFLLHELMTSLVSDGIEPDVSSAAAVAGIAPASIARAVLIRLVRLGGEAVAVAEAAATLATDARLDRVAALAGVPAERAAALADKLAAAGILEPGDALAFCHPILRAAVHGQTPAQRRGLAHLGAAELLLDGGLGPERAASHLLVAPSAGREWVVETLRRAAATALGRGAPDASVTLLRRAIDEGDGEVAETLIELSAAEFTVQHPAAIQHALAARAAATTPALRAQAGLAAARALIPLGRYDEVLDVLRAVEVEAERLDAVSRQAVRAEALVLSSWYRGVTGLAEPLAAIGVDDLRGDTPAERLLLSLRTMEVASHGRSRSETLALARRAAKAADPLDAFEENTVLITARVLGIADAVDEGEALLTALLDGGRRRGAVLTVLGASTIRAELLFRVGRLVDAESDAREALRLATEYGLSAFAVGALAVSVEVLLDRAAPGRAAEQLASLDEPDVPFGYVGNMIAFARGCAAAATGDVDTAAAQLEACGAGRTAWGEINPASSPWRSRLALVLAALGRLEEASQLADEELRLARRFGADRASGIALRACALLRSGDEQVEGLREAANTLARSPARLEHARTLLDLGAALRRTGHRSEAREVLARALDGCQACGALELAVRARAELRTAGARPRRDRLTGPHALTAAERRVVELAAGGMTNRQVAQALFLTTKTVESHLGHAYPKLGITRRAELEAVLHTAARHG